MVRHDDEFIQFDVGEMCGDVMPMFFRYEARIIQDHFPVRNIAEQARAIIEANGHEICAFSRVIVPLQAQRMAVMLIRIVACVHYLSLPPASSAPMSPATARAMAAVLPHRDS